MKVESAKSAKYLVESLERAYKEKERLDELITCLSEHRHGSKFFYNPSYYYYSKEDSERIYTYLLKIVNENIHSLLEEIQKL
jgi:hypothetical protein